MKNSHIPLILILSLPAVSQAELTPIPYVGVAYEQQNIDIDGTDFDSSMLMLHAGAWLWEGIGFELELGSGITDDSSNGLSFEHTSLLRYGVRLQTPATPNNTVLYVLLGGASSELNLQTDGDGIPGRNRFNGYHAGIGLGTQLNANLQLDISYNNYQVDENIEISGIRLNVEYTFGAYKR